MLGISRKEVHDILDGKSGREQLEIVTVAGKRRVTKESFEKWYAGQRRYRFVADRNDPDAAAEKNLLLALHRKNRESFACVGSGNGNQEYLTRSEAALVGNVSVNTVTKWYYRGLIPAKKMGSIIRIPRKEYEMFLQERTRKKEEKSDGIYPEKK